MRVAAQITKTNMVGIATSRMRLLRRLIRSVRFSFMKNGLTCSESMVKAKNFLCYLLHRQKCVGHDKLFFCIYRPLRARNSQAAPWTRHNRAGRQQLNTLYQCLGVPVGVIVSVGSP